MNRSRLLWIIAALALLAAAGGGYAWWNIESRNSQIVAGLPHQPDLSRWNSELRDRIADCEHRVRFGPDRVGALAELSRLYHANGFYPEASRCYQTLLRVDPSNPRWAHLLATLLAQYGDLDHALPLWRWVVQKDPDHIQAAIRLGDALLKDNKVDEAEAAYKHVLARDANNAYAELGLARIAVSRDRWDDARKLLEAASASTDYAIGGDLLVTVYEHLGLNDQALALRGATKASGAYFDVPDPWIDDMYQDCYDVYRLIIYSGNADHAGGPQVALEIAERAVRLDPDDGHAQFQVGCLYERSNQPLKAAAAMKNCIAVLPEFADAWYHLYAIQRDQGDMATAVQTLAVGIRTCPKSPGLHLEMGNVLAKAGRYDDAIAEYTTAAELRPQEADAQLDLASLYFKLNRTDEGIAELHAAIEAQPGHPAALTALAVCAIKLGQENEARKWLRQISYQPRIQPQERDAIVNAFRMQFGHAP